jgi:hypothetical protein
MEVRLTRRRWVRRAALAAGALGLGAVERVRAASGNGAPSHRAVINILLVGGPSHIDTVDLKPQAPAEIRGEFRPIPTRVPGVDLCELLPGLAARMDRVVILRSLQGAVEQHLSDLCVSGYPMSADGRRQGDHPALGPVAAHLLPDRPGVPPFVGFGPPVGTIASNVGEPGFLGEAYAAFRPDAATANVLAMPGLDLGRLGRRRGLLEDVEAFRRGVDRPGALDALDDHSRRAFEVLASRRVAVALDLSREDPRLVARYGRGGPPADAAYAPYFMDQFLVARRLVEAGVRVVTVPFGLWDTHAHNFTDRPGHGLRYSLPRLDQGLSALIDDLHARGLERDVAVVVWGEFGRTPRINGDAGRDHWPAVSPALLIGGGFRGGQAIGATDKWAARVVSRPIHFQQVLAALYRHLGIDVDRALLSDRLGRPVPLLEHREPIRGLLG